MTTNDDLTKLIASLSPYLIEANQHGHSMCTMEIDPRKFFDLPYQGKDPRMVVAFAIGPSAPILRQAIEMALHPQ